MDRVVTFISESYVDALNGDTFDGQFRCTLLNGSDFVAGQDYRPLDEFRNCSTVSYLYM